MSRGSTWADLSLELLNENRIILISGHSLGDLPVDMLSLALIYAAVQVWQVMMLIIGRRYGVDPGAVGRIDPGAVGRIGRLPGPGD